MATTKVTLIKGIDLGGKPQLECELREPTAGDMIDASEESEKLVQTPSGPELVTSPTLVGINTLRRQVVRIGEIPGPLDLSVIKKLSAEDLDLLQGESVRLEQAAQEAASRGRSDGSGAGVAASH